jgi:hypothetical protein
MIYLHNQRKEQVRECENRAEAEDQKKKLIELGMSPDNLAITTEDPRDNTETKADGGSQDVEVVEDETPTEEPKPTQADSDALDEVQNKDLGTDPLSVMPGHFVDTIQGVPTINRKGYAVLAEHFGVSVTAEPVTLPSETDFEYAEFRAVATTEDGQEYSGFGSAHVERGDGDDPHLLGELAETRALKRATSWATGIGITAFEEMTNDL